MGSTTKEIVFKSFVIQHPIHKDKCLVYFYLEGAESGVYYRHI